MKVEIFDYNLPKELIASAPANPRHSSRLLDLSDGNTINDKSFSDIAEVLKNGDLLVCNNTKVIPARLYAKRGDAKVEVTLYRPLDGLLWWAFIKNSKRLKINDEIIFYNDEGDSSQFGFTATIMEKDAEDGSLLRFNCEESHFPEMLKKFGYMPLPPYIKRERPGVDSIWHKYNDTESYQTIYASKEGAVAAPTAGLHFTEEVMQQLKEKGINRVFVTLHVGAGTFLPVKTDKTEDHKMHAEYGVISKEVADIINQTKQNGGRVIAVGTTSLRLLESAADSKGIIHPFAQETDIFITPGYKFKIIDMLITNFHLPKSTLFMLVCAVAGIEKMQEVYAHAIKEKYRFYSYGDSSILKCVNKI